jgi:hypothetical protein
MAKYSSRVFFGVCLVALLLLAVLWCLPCAKTVFGTHMRVEHFQDAKDKEEEDAAIADLTGVNISSASDADSKNFSPSSNNLEGMNLPSDPAGMQQFMSQILLQAQATGTPQAQTIAELKLAFTGQGIPPGVVDAAMDQALASIGGSNSKPTLQQCQKYYACQCLTDLVLVPPGMAVNAPTDKAKI